MKDYIDVFENASGGLPIVHGIPEEGNMEEMQLESIGISYEAASDLRDALNYFVDSKWIEDSRKDNQLDLDVD